MGIEQGFNPQPVEYPEIKAVGNFESKEKLQTGDVIKYTRVDGATIDVEVLDQPEGISPERIYVRVPGVPNQLKGFMAQVPLRYFSPEAKQAFAEIAQQIKEKHEQLTAEEKANAAVAILEAQTAIEAGSLPPQLETSFGKWKEFGAALGIMILFALMLATGRVESPKQAEAKETPAVGAPAAEHGDAVVHKGEGITQAFQRQLEADPELAKMVGYDGTPKSIVPVARNFGYIAKKGNMEVWVAKPGVQYKLVKDGQQVFVEEYDETGKLQERKSMPASFEKGEALESYETNHSK